MAAGCFGLPSKAGRGVTQGGPVFPTIFKLVVDAVIREWERLLAIHHNPLDKICTLLVAIFYAVGGIIAARNLKTLHRLCRWPWTFWLASSTVSVFKPTPRRSR